MEPLFTRHSVYHSLQYLHADSDNYSHVTHVQRLKNTVHITRVAKIVQPCKTGL